MAEIKDVKAWREHQKIGHIVAFSQNGWEMWACGTYTPGQPPYRKRPPKRLCRKCMERLKDATVAT